MNVLLIAGSNRRNATSTRLCAYIARIVEREGLRATLFDLHEKPLPFYSPDIEEYADANLDELKREALAADAIVLATPEYHGGMYGVLKNALDHLDSEHFDNKAVLSVSSTGGAVGVSSLLQLQASVRNLHGVNSPEWISIGGENRSFGEDGVPANEKVRQRTERAVRYFLRLAATLKS